MCFFRPEMDSCYFRFDLEGSNRIRSIFYKKLSIIGAREYDMGDKSEPYLTKVLRNRMETQTGFEIDRKRREMRKCVEQEPGNGTRVVSESDVVSVSAIVACESLKQMLTQVARTSHNHYFRLLHSVTKSSTIDSPMFSWFEFYSFVQTKSFPSDPMD